MVSNKKMTSLDSTMFGLNSMLNNTLATEVPLPSKMRAIGERVSGY